MTNHYSKGRRQLARPNLEAQLVEKEAKNNPRGAVHDSLQSGGSREERVVGYEQHGVTLGVLKVEEPKHGHGDLLIDKYHFMEVK